MGEMLPLRVRRPEDRRPGVISVTLPSRHRTRMLTDSIASLRRTAKHPELLEILVAYDPDDTETADAAEALGVDVVWRAPERFGYAESARYYAALLEQATGEWSVPTWGDDGLMRTDGWDDMVRATPAGSVIYVEGNVPGMTCYPIVHMDVFATLGRFCPLPALDTWYEYVARDAGILAKPPIYVHQDRFDLTGNNDDETYQEGRSGYRIGEFFSADFARLRSRDASRIQHSRRLFEDYQHRMRTWSDVQQHMPAMYEAARRYPGGTVLELGTRIGNSTAALLAGAVSVNGRVVSVDPGPVGVPVWWQGRDTWTFLPLDDVCEQALTETPRSVDVLFIDTSHYYEHTLQELRAYVPRVKPGGTVLMHDTELTREQITAYEGRALEGPDIPVAQALDEYCAETGLTWTNTTGCFGLGRIDIPA